MANISIKPDISQINSFSERLSKLKSLKFLHQHYKDVLAVIKNIYSYVDHLEEENTRLSMAYNKEREKRKKLQLHTALLQFEMNKHFITPTLPYLQETNIKKYFTSDESYYNEFNKAFSYKPITK